MILFLTFFRKLFDYEISKLIVFTGKKGKGACYS